MDLRSFIAWLLGLDRRPAMTGPQPDFEDTTVTIYERAGAEGRDQAIWFGDLQEA